MGLGIITQSGTIRWKNGLFIKMNCLLFVSIDSRGLGLERELDDVN